MNRTLSVVGIALTGIYIVGLTFLFSNREADILALAPNNMGDFLAGVFGPLSILWLILGFFQQGIELRQNTRALELQAEELKNSVEQQRELVEVTRQQVTAELEAIHAERERQQEAARPKFVFHGVGAMMTGGEVTYNTVVKNLGNTATDITFTFSSPIKLLSLTTVFSWSRGEEKHMSWQYMTPAVKERTELTIRFIDSAGLDGEQRFEFLPVSSEPCDMVEIRPLKG